LHPTFFQLGPLHIPFFGAVAAIGLMAALALSQRTARYADLDPAALWDAGLTGMIAAFVISRALLVVFNFHSFLMYPVLLMAVPSLTTTGVLLTAVFLVIYLRRKRLPLLAVLDAFHPVELYTLLVALALCATLFGLLRRRGYTGRTTAIGLLIAGVAMFFLDFFRLPSDLLPNPQTAWLDPAQFLALGMIAVGGVLILAALAGPSEPQQPDRIGARNAF
jgi:phosphatidylglycerol---prolipoprotein diacylglyceryl transferase